MVRLINNLNIFISILIIFISITSRIVNAAIFNIPSGNVNELINAINEANSNGEDDIIDLQSGTYSLTAVNNDHDGPNGLPSIPTNITIIGAGADTTIIERDESAPSFRIFHLAATGNLTLYKLTAKNGLSSSEGGGIFNRGNVTINNSNIANNTANGGGGIVNLGMLAATSSTINGNQSNDSNATIPGIGGGILNDTGTAIIINSTVANNNAVVQGGGIGNIDGTVTIINSLIAENIAGIGLSGGTGGGIENRFGTLNIINSTITRNMLNPVNGGGGGGIRSSDGTVNLTNSTIAGNTAGFGGGLENNSLLGGVNLQNTMLALNARTGIASCCPDCSGTFTSLGNNLITDHDPTGCNFPLQPSDLTGDPGLSAFTDDGTPGNGHFPLLPDSQAIDAGNNDVCLDDPILATDQIGNPRFGICDIGSIEFQPRFKNKGQCISSMIKENCSGLKGKNRGTCNHQQQQFCKSLFK